MTDTVLPHETGDAFLIDGGLETTLVFREGIDLPHFSSAVLLGDAEGEAQLRRYFARYAAVAREAGMRFIFEAPLWRASREWGARLGYTAEGADALNRRGVEFVHELQSEHRGLSSIVSACIGPRGDGYAPDAMMDAPEAARHHAPQLRTIAEAGVDMASAMTMTHAGEAAGFAIAAAELDLPFAVWLTVETDGRLPSGQPLDEAIGEIDAASGCTVAFYGINCAHPDHFAGVLDGPWTSRIRGVRANASRCSHAELDEAEELDAGDPREFGHLTAVLRDRLPNLNVFGGCCGTDHRHVRAIVQELTRS